MGYPRGGTRTNSLPLAIDPERERGKGGLTSIDKGSGKT